MKVILVTTVVLTEFSVGSLLMASLLPTREIRVGLFTLVSLMSALTAAVALLLLKYGTGATWVDVRFLGLTVIGATVAYGCFKLERLDAGRMALIVAGLVGLVCGLMPLASRALTELPVTTKVPLVFELSILAGALLMGATNVGMILGHWYLMMRRLSFEYLERFAKLLLFTVGLRGLMVVATYFFVKNYDPVLAHNFLQPLLAVDGNFLFFVLRLLFGIAGPLILGFMVLRCVQEKANQAATGLLYVAEISVFFGELFAAILLI